jgi:hypothetical protein
MHIGSTRKLSLRDGKIAAPNPGPGMLRQAKTLPFISFGLICQLCLKPMQIV